MRIIDISVPFHEGMVVWPGSERFERKIASRIAAGDTCNLSEIVTSLHAGTHVDAPRHFVEDGATIERIDPAVFVGPCRVVAVDNPKAVDRADLARHDLAGVERLLVKTSNSALLRQPTFVESFVGLTAGAAQYLATIESLRLVGTDYYSIAPYDEAAAIAVHEAILGSGIIALEGVDLNDVEPGDYELVALPLRIEGADGSPVRAVLIDRRD